MEETSELTAEVLGKIVEKESREDERSLSWLSTGSKNKHRHRQNVTNYHFLDYFNFHQ